MAEDKKESSSTGRGRDDQRVSERLEELSQDELKHLSLSTEIVKGKKPEARPAVEKSEEANTADSKKQQLRAATGVLNKKLARKGSGVGNFSKSKVIAGIAGAGIILVLIVVAVLLPVLFPKRPATGVFVPDTTPTPSQAGGAALPVLTVEDLQGDQDGDSIPDNLELMLGYDPQANDCVRSVGCGDFPSLPRTQLRLNLIFILDASGSMREQVDGMMKWESALQALEQVLDRGFPRFTDVGLIVYGHQGSSSPADQAVSCSGVEVAQDLQPWGGSQVREVTEGLDPNGWTPLGLALRQAGAMLENREGEGNFVVVLSDGTETCGGDPVAEARQLHESGIEVTTNVVGLVVSDEERQQLQAIAEAGGGRYFPAEDSQELEQALYLSSEAIRLWEQINQCIIDNLDEYGQCINVQYLKAINRVKDTRLQLENEAALNGVTWQSLDQAYITTEEEMWETFEALREDNWSQYVQDLEGLSVGR